MEINKGQFLSDGTRAEVSYLLDPLARHKGYATEAVSFLMKVAFDSYMVNQVVAEIHKDNQPSIDLVERLGFRCIEAKEILNYLLLIQFSLLEFVYLLLLQQNLTLLKN